MSMTASLKRLSVMILLHTALLAMPSYGGAQEPQPVPIRFGSHSTFQRMVLDWPGTVAYFLEQSNKNAALIFEAPVSFHPAQIARGLAQVASDVAVASDGRRSRISFELAEGVQLRHFRVDTKIVVDFVHDGRPTRISPAAEAKSRFDDGIASGEARRPWENLPLSGTTAHSSVWAAAGRALAPPPATTVPAQRPEPPPVELRQDRKAAATEPSRAAPVPPPASTAPVRLAAPSPPDQTSAAPAAEPMRAAATAASPSPPWRQAVREAACRGDLERATAILTERSSASPLDPIDWYNLTWLLRTLAGVTMEPPPKPANAPVYEAPLIGLCSGKPVDGTVATWQRLAHAGQFTEFLIDVAPAGNMGRR